MTQDQRLRRRERLTLDGDFDRVFTHRCSASDGVLVVYAAPNELGWSRLGIRTSRRINKAVDRSYVRRRIRDAFRTNKDRIPAGFDLVCVPRATAADRRIDISRSLVSVADRAAKRCEARGSHK